MHQHGCTGIPVGVTPTGTDSGECGTNRNPPPTAPVRGHINVVHSSAGLEMAIAMIATIRATRCCQHVA